MTPQLSTSLPSFSAEDPGGWEHLRRRAIVADKAGVDRVVCSDHVAYGENLEAYGDPKKGGQVGGKQPTGPDGHWLDPFTVLTWVAAQTDRVRLGTNIMIAPLRRPVVLAKELATLDVLSGGRVDLGVGVGWQRAEYDAAGVPFERRGDLLDESLDLCRRLWRDGAVELPGGRVHQQPQPRHAGGVPLWISGRSTNRRVLDRIVRFGSGWIPWGDDVADPRPGIARIRDAMAAAGRADDTIQVTVRLPEDPAVVADLAAAGVTDFRAWARSGSDEELAELVARFRDATA